MQPETLPTTNPNLNLTPPNPDRDTPFAVDWFEHCLGKQTLLLMGNPEHKITPTSYAKERVIIESFVAMNRDGEQLTWVMRYRGQGAAGEANDTAAPGDTRGNAVTSLSDQADGEVKTIGAIWVELTPGEHMPAPAISLMIGDPAARGKGVGRASMQAVIGYLKKHTDYPTLYARRLTDNRGSAALLDSVGFRPLSEPYTDEDGLAFQNFSLVINR